MVRPIFFSLEDLYYAWDRCTDGERGAAPSDVKVSLNQRSFLLVGLCACAFLRAWARLSRGGGVLQPVMLEHWADLRGRIDRPWTSCGCWSG
jgi:hypothetical protein